MQNKIKSITDIKSGYVIELDNCKRYLVGRFGNFRKFAKSNDNDFIFLDNFDKDFRNEYHSITAVFGLSITCGEAFTTIIGTRELLWQQTWDNLAKRIWDLELDFQDILFLSNLDDEVKYLKFNSNLVSGRTVELFSEDMKRIQISRLRAYSSKFLNAKDEVLYKRD